MRSGMALIVAFTLLASVAVAQDVTWQMRYDEESSGVSNATITFPTSLAWKYATEAETFNAVATPAVDENAVYAPVGDTIYAIDRLTGALLWEQSAGDEILSSPAIADGILYFGSRDDNPWAIDTRDGSVEWRYATGGGIDTPPVIAYGVIYFGSDDNRITALDLETRRPLWQFQTSGDIKAAPLVYRDVVVVGSLSGDIYCLNSNGQLIWSESIEPNNFFASPVGERTKVIYASGRDLNARDLYSGRLVWGRPFRAGDLIVGSPAVYGRNVYIGTRDGSVYGIDSNRGAAMWKWPSDGAAEPIASSPVIVDDMIVFRSGARDLVAISLDGRDLLWKYTLPEAETKVATPVGGMTEPGMMDPGMMDPGMMLDPGMGPAPGMEPPMIEPGMEPGLEPGIEPGVGPGTGQYQVQELKFEKVVDPSVAVVDNALFTLGDDGVIYGFSSLAPDNVAPTIADAVLEVPGGSRQRARFDMMLADEDDFPDRYADEIAVPGTPPIFISVLVQDEGTGVNPEMVSVTLNGQPASYTYDAREGLVWYIYDPRGAAANLPNGVKQVMIEAVDWRGNRAVKYVSFTVDNKLKAPAPPKPRVPTFEPGAFPGEMMPPEMMP